MALQTVTLAEPERPAPRRLAWTVWAVAMAFGAAYVVLFVLNLGQHLPGAAVELAQSPPFLLVGGTIGALVASRRSSNPIGWLLLFFALALAVQEALEHYAILSYLTRDQPLPGARWAAWIQAWLLQSFFPIPLAVMLMLVPDGRFRSARWRRFAAMALAINAVGLVTIALTPGRLEAGCCQYIFPVTNPAGLSVLRHAAESAGAGPASSIAMIVLTFFGVLVVLPAAVVSLALRRREGTAEVRGQIGLVLVAIGLTVVLFLVGLAVALKSQEAADPIFTVAVTVIAVGVPVSIGLGILRHRLFDVEVVIRKTVLYATVAILLVVLFLLVAVAVSGVAGRTQVGAVAAAAAIGLLFQPAVRLSRRIADRVVYGTRATPYEVLADFAERVAGPQAPEGILGRMAQVLGEAVGAARSEVWLHVGRELRVAASWPPGAGVPPPVPIDGDDLPPIPGMSHAVAVRDGEQLLGALAVRKPPNDPVAPNEERLVANLASQAALVLRNIRLIEELKASRQRLVGAQDTERRRIERNIHDGAQQQLVALAVKLRLVEQLSERDPLKAKEIAAALQSDAQAALEELRDLARGIYPPLLADKGLPDALESQARRSPIPVKVESDGVARYPQEIEAAVYFCCLEALQNVAKYARASAARVQLAAADRAVTFAVSDDGVGFDPVATRHGAGLTNMRDRVEALGGSLEVRSAPAAGTTISGRIPLAQDGPAPG